MLNPKKHSDFYRKVAEQLGIPESEVLDIVSFYWRAVRKKMESLEEPYILVEGLGTFYVKTKSLKQQIIKNELYVRQHNPKDFKKYPFYKVSVEKLEKLNSLFSKVITERDRKSQHIKHRKNGTKPTGSVETPGTDS